MIHRTKQRAKAQDNSRSRRNGVETLECLEPRLLLYAANGGVWAHPELVTVSFMPDGTSIGGSPSALFAKMNSKWTSATWQKEILKGLQSYAANTNINFSVRTDDGSAWGSAGGSGTDNNVQGDSNFGDIRIGGYDMGTGKLGLGMLAPPKNLDTTAGDFFFNTNSTITWNMGSSYDVYTVSAHEAGHSNGLDHSTTSSAVMYSSYPGTKTALTTDDISGMQSVYGGARTKDSFDTTASNGTTSAASVVTSYIDSNKQISFSNLDITTTSDVDFYKFTVPTGAASSMTIKMQSSGLSLLAPKLELWNSSGKLISGKSVSGAYNSTVQLTYSIAAGQVYYIRASGADTTVFGTGKYGLQVNMGTATQNAVASPNTATASSGSGGVSSYISQYPNLPWEQLIQWIIDQLKGEQLSATGGATDPGSAVLPLQHQYPAVVSDIAGFEVTASHQGDGGWSAGHSGVGHHGPSALFAFADAGWSGDLTAPGYESLPVGSNGHAREVSTDLVDHVADTNPVDVVRPGFALVCDLASL